MCSAQCRHPVNNKLTGYWFYKHQNWYFCGRMRHIVHYLWVPDVGAGAYHNVIMSNGTQGLCRSPEFCSYEYHFVYLVIMCYVQCLFELCRLSGCLRGELVLTITPDGTLNCCLTFKFCLCKYPIIKQSLPIYYAQHSTLLVVCANLQYRWVPEGVVLIKTLKGAQISVLLHNIVVFAILLDFVFTFSYFRNCATCICTCAYTYVCALCVHHVCVCMHIF